MKDKYCKDCKWKEDKKDKFPKCFHPKSCESTETEKIDLISGIIEKIPKKDRYKFCKVFRLCKSRKNTCGIEGSLFEQKTSEPLKKKKKKYYPEKYDPIEELEKLVIKHDYPSFEKAKKIIADDDAKKYYPKGQSKPKTDPVPKELEPPDIDNDDDNFAPLEIEEN